MCYKWFVPVKSVPFMPIILSEPTLNTIITITFGGTSEKAAKIFLNEVYSFFNREYQLFRSNQYSLSAKGLIFFRGRTP